MNDGFHDATISVGLIAGDDSPDGRATLAATATSIQSQDLRPVELIVAGANGALDALPAGDVPIRLCRGPFANRAAMGNALLHAAQGEFLLIIDNALGATALRQSAVRLFSMAARRTGAGMVYGDYERRDADGQLEEVRLLHWHAGRLRDDVDFGPAILYRTALLREIGGFDERFAAAEQYDLRLRVSERAAPKHIANRFAGSICTISAAATGHDVFAYLRKDRAAQLEAEQACTEHLQRTGAWLAPGAHVGAIDYAPDVQARFADCVASVVIPVNRRPEFIGRAIDSVQAQTEQRVEAVIVVNGGEEDPTADAVRRYLPGGDLHQPTAPPVRLLVVDVNNLGLCLNTGVAAARGKYYVQLDSDDRLKPEAVQKTLEVFDSDPTIGMVVGSYEVWTLDERTGELTRNADIPVVKHEEWTADNGRNNLLRINGAGAPRAAHIKAIRDAGWFGVNDTPHCRNYGEDYDLVLRISERYAIGRVWEPIYEVIRHAGGTDHAIDPATVDRNNEAKDHMRLEALQRRRALNGAANER